KLLGQSPDCPVMVHVQYFSPPHGRFAMRIRKSFAFIRFVVFPVSLLAVCALPLVSAANGAGDPPAARPRPDLATKVYTNDDIGGWRSATPVPTASVAPSQTASSIPVPSSSASSNSPALTPGARYVNPRQDPEWYAQQLAQLQTELAAVEGKESQLRDFRASGSTQTPPTGLVLNAPCEGITTDNEIARLEARRQEIAQQ